MQWKWGSLHVAPGKLWGGGGVGGSLQTSSGGEMKRGGLAAVNDARPLTPCQLLGEARGESWHYFVLSTEKIIGSQADSPAPKALGGDVLRCHAARGRRKHKYTHAGMQKFGRRLVQTSLYSDLNRINGSLNRYKHVFNLITMNVITWIWSKPASKYRDIFS